MSQAMIDRLQRELEEIASQNAKAEESGRLWAEHLASIRQLRGFGSACLRSDVIDSMQCFSSYVDPANANDPSAASAFWSDAIGTCSPSVEQVRSFIFGVAMKFREVEPQLKSPPKSKALTELYGI